MKIYGNDFYFYFPKEYFLLTRTEEKCIIKYNNFYFAKIDESGRIIDIRV